MSTQAKRSVVIYGGGIAGGVLANKLSQDLRVTLVDPRDYFKVPMAAPRNLVEPGFAEGAIVAFADAMPAVEHVRAKLVEMTRQGGVVEYEDGSRGLVTGDASVLATGSRFPNELMRAYEGSATDRKAFYLRFNDRLLNAQRILIVGGGPIGVETAGEISEKFPHKTVIILEAGDRLLAGTSAAAAAHAAHVLAERGVIILTGERLEGDGRPTDDVFAGGGEATTSSGRRIPYDLIIWCTGGRPNTAYMAAEFVHVLDALGRIKVTPQLRVEGEERLFAIGDITNLDEAKKAAYIRGHVKTAASNIRAMLADGPSVRPLATYKAQTDNPVMVVTLGSKTGVAHLPLVGVVRSAWFNRKAKAEKMLVPMYRKAIGA
jgi:NADH dehydrogenase FAD-containing subunit